MCRGHYTPYLPTIGTFLQDISIYLMDTSRRTGVPGSEIVTGTDGTHRHRLLARGMKEEIRTMDVVAIMTVIAIGIAEVRKDTAGATGPGSTYIRALGGPRQQGRFFVLFPIPIHKKFMLHYID
jgi:hypothetical protein